MQVPFQKIAHNAVTPIQADEGAAGFDMVATQIDTNNNIVTIHTGIAIAIPEGYAGFLFPRSSVYKTGMMLANCVGVIDSSYRGEIICKFRKFDLQEGYQVGDRCCQLVIMPVPKVVLCEQSKLNNTSRGSGGFGSTGR